MSLEEELQLIDNLETVDPEKDEQWQELSNDKKELFQNFVLVKDKWDDSTFSLKDYDTTRLWNILDAEQKAGINDDEPKVIKLLPETIKSYLREAAGRIERVCLSILIEFKYHVTESLKKKKQPRAIDLLRFFGQFYTAEPIQPPHNSGDAFSDTNDCHGTSIGSSLIADEIHYNMFQDEDQLTFQKFKRFKLGGGRDEKSQSTSPDWENLIASFGLADLKHLKLEWTKFLPHAKKDLDCARAFLEQFRSPDEALTQCVFKEFLTELMKKMNAADDAGEHTASPNVAIASHAAEHSTPANVAIVAGMDTIELPVTVSKRYMQLQAKKRREPDYPGDSKIVPLKVKSDLVIIKGSPAEYEHLAAGEQQQELFLNSNVNVEMKTWGLLPGRQNNSPLTQVAAESLVRYIKLGDQCPKILYSMLTDCSALHAVVHFVDKQEYWVSRSVTSTEEIILSICWLYLCSIGKVDPKVTEWKDEDETVGVDEAMKDGGTSLASQHDIMDDGDETESNQQYSPKADATATAVAYEDYELISFLFSFDEKKEEREEDRKYWQMMFLLENHLNYGARLPLTESFLSIYNTTEEDSLYSR